MYPGLYYICTLTDICVLLADTKVIGDPTQREVPKDMASVLDESAQTLFLTEMMRGLNLTLKAFFDEKVTVSLLSLTCSASATTPKKMSVMGCF